MLCHVGYGGVPCLIITPRQTRVGRVHRCSSTLKPFGALLNWARNACQPRALQSVCLSVPAASAHEVSEADTITTTTVAEALGHSLFGSFAAQYRQMFGDGRPETLRRPVMGVLQRFGNRREGLKRLHQLHHFQASSDCALRLTALIEIPQVCLSEFPTCEQRSVYRLAGAGGGASEAIGCGVVIA